MAEGEFAELLGELKRRSGLSYGALGKRLHMSASTVHRYVSGDVVPTDYAPVERFARVCRATPEELLELHRRWLRADALRGVKSGGSAEAREAEPGREPGRESVHDPDPAPAPVPGPEPKPKPESKPESEPEPGRESEPRPEQRPGSVTEASADARAAGRTTHGAGSVRPKRRTALFAGAAVVAVAAATALVVNLVPGDGQRPDGEQAAGAAVSAGRSSAERGGRSASPTGGTSSASPSPSRTASGSASPSSRLAPPSAAAPSSPSGAARPGGASDAAPFTVGVTPYYWDLPCEQYFLIDRSPKNVPPPPPQQNAVGYASALGAVAADSQMVVLTVQGTGPETVVLQGLHVRVVSSGAKLSWNKYAMGDGCGGGVNTKSFDVSLDLGNPLAQPIAGQRNFPYKVSESDPEVFYVNGHTSGHDVRWYLELEWSSGDRHGTVRVDDHGKPFRTSGSGAPYWVSPLNGNGWELANYG
ncbi:helix-turn-helix domain-containing protein [Streptomyces seoulensis]|nr:helix-turn-helix domain-containing protein [Streptomyces seoulensis]